MIEGHINVTIIVPIYNSSQYLNRCIDSLINQSYKNIQMILIDDNSSDDSLSLITDYGNRYSNIFWYHNEQQQGASKTRNWGLEKANTEYVGFLDSDDWLDLNCIDKAVSTMSNDSSIDIAVWEIKTAQKFHKTAFRYRYEKNNVIDGSMALKLLSHTSENEYFLSPLLGAKLFRRSLLNKYQIFFPDTMYEDDFFSFLAFTYAKKVSLIVDCSLYYYQHSSSLTHHFTKKNIDDFYETFSSLYILIRNSNSSAVKESFYHYLQKSLYSLIKQLDVCVQNEYECQHFKYLICNQFGKAINMEEYFKFCDQICF